MIKQGHITPHQLLEALTIQLRQSPMLGEIAEHEGLMTLEQVLDVLNYQAKFPEAPFARAARDLALLTHNEIQWLVKRQHSSRPYLGEILVSEGFTTQEVVATELTRYKATQWSGGAGAPSTTPEATTHRATE